jgi:hypothetical protein
MKDPKVQEFLGKVSNHQGCIDAMMNVKKIFEAKGTFISLRQAEGNGC